MQIEVKGKIVNVLPTLSGQGKNGEWVKNSFVIEWQDSGYKQLLCLEVIGEDKFDKMKNAVKVGYDVMCRFSVSSREWNGKYFTSCQCFYCANIGGQEQPNVQQSQQSSNPFPPSDASASSDDGLPF